MASTITVDKIKGGTSGVALTLPTTDGSAGQLLKTNGSAVLSWATDAGGIASLAADTTPQLGGNLDLNSNNITGTGAIPAANLTGALPAISGANLTGLASDNVATDLLVATGESVTVGQVVSLIGNTIGKNPVPVTLGSTIQNGLIDFTWVNKAGTVGVVKDTSNASILNSYLIGDTSITLVTALSAFDSNSGGMIIKSQSDNTAIMVTTYHNGSTNYWWSRLLTVNPTTGVASVGTQRQDTFSSTNGFRLSELYNTDSHETAKVGFYRNGYNSGYFPYYGTYGVSGTSLVYTTSNSSIRSTDESVKVGSYLLRPDSGSSWTRSPWNGTTTTGSSDTITTEYTDGGEKPFMYRPVSGAGTFVLLFKTAGSKLVLETYTSDGTNLLRVANSRFTLVDILTSDYLIGEISGNATDILVTWSDNLKGYAQAVKLDSNKIAITSGVVTTISSAPVSPKNRFSGTADIFRTWWNSPGSSTQKASVASYDSEPANVIGVSSEAASAGSTAGIVVKGVAGGFTGLTAGLDYYYDETASDGSVTATIGNNFVGKAISTTEILI